MRRLVSAVCLALAVLAAAPAFADLEGFNKAVIAGDYKAAAAQAADAWPTLDKTSADIAVIAREFGYAAYIAKDYSNMRSYAQVAANPATPGNADRLSLAVSAVLLRTAEHRLGPTGATRNALAAAMAKRSELAGLDNISVIGVDVLIAYDLDKGDWKNLRASTQTGVKLATAGGPRFQLLRRRLEMYSAISVFLDERSTDVYPQFKQLRDSIIADIDVATSDEAAQIFVPLRWEITAWLSLARTYLYSSGKRIPRDILEAEAKEAKERVFSPRVVKLIHIHDDEEPCARAVKMKRKVVYPPSARFKGYVGSVFLQIDIDAQGKAYNPKILAAIPEAPFGEAVLKSVPDIGFEGAPGRWEKTTCQMEHKNHVIEFVFQM